MCQTAVHELSSSVRRLQCDQFIVQSFSNVSKSVEQRSKLEKSSSSWQGGQSLGYKSGRVRIGGMSKTNQKSHQDCTERRHS